MSPIDFSGITISGGERMRNLRGKVAVVTGAGSGIGRALAVGLSREGTDLALCDIDGTGLEETGSIILKENFRGHLEVYQVNVARREAVEEFAHEVIRDFGGVDIVINNAGVSSSGGVEELTYETLHWTIDINLWGVIHVTKAFLPCLRRSPEASIVNLSSVYGLLGVPGQAAYCASKFGVRGFTEALRQELYQSNITVTLVFPGGVKTRIARNSRTDYHLDPETYEAGLRRIEATFKTTAAEAAQVIIQGIQKKTPRILIGKDAGKIDLLARTRPGSYDRVIAKYLRRVESH